jgi:hypothetical protein
MDRPRYFYKMFQMSVDIFMALHVLLVSTNGLTSTNNVSSVESLAMFLWIVGGPQSFSQAKNHLTLSVFNRLPTMGYTQGGKFWVKERRDQELEGARNTKLRQVRAARCVTPYILYGGLYCLWCRMT